MNPSTATKRSRRRSGVDRSARALRRTCSSDVTGKPSGRRPEAKLTIDRTIRGSWRNNRTYRHEHPNDGMEPRMGIEPTTPALRKRCTTAVLPWLAVNGTRQNYRHFIGKTREKAHSPGLDLGVLREVGIECYRASRDIIKEQKLETALESAVSRTT